MVKTTVNTLFMPSKMRRSSDHGGIFGLSIASVIQLAAMNTKMIKSNQFFSTKVLHWSRNLKSYEKKNTDEIYLLTKKVGQTFVTIFR